MSQLDLPVISKRDGIEDAATCEACGGRCCQNAPGITHPSDFGPRKTLAATIADYLRTGFWSVDWWEGDVVSNGKLSQVYFVRPATVYGKGKARDPSWGGACILWAEGIGCSLAFENRPHECRHLKPIAGNFHCKGKGKPWYVKQWRPFQAEIIAALEEIEARP